jgi:hypothetical protein
MKGIYQHCGEKHLHRYLAENGFRYNNRVALGVRLPNYWRWISCAGGEICGKLNRIRYLLTMAPESHSVVQSCNLALLTYMSIQDQIDGLVAQGQLCPLGSGEETPRVMYCSLEVMEMVDDALGDTREAEMHAAATVVLESFVDGCVITISQDPYLKDRDTLLARTDPGREHDNPITSEIWDFRCLDPNPGIRVLGCFSEKDVFIALTWDYRPNFDVCWPEKVQQCKQEWLRLFGDTPPLKRRQLHEYVSDPFEIS